TSSRDAPNLLLGGRALGRRLRRPVLVVERLLQKLAGLEVEHAARRDDDRVAGLWIPPLPLPLVSQHEVAETRYLYLLPSAQRFFHRLEYEVDEIGGLLFREEIGRA